MTVARDRRVLELVADVMGLLDIDELSHGLIVALRRVVASDWSALHELPADLPRTIALADPPLPEALHRTFARYADQNPLVRHFMGTRDGRATRFSDPVTLAELRRLDLYREVYAPLGVDYQIAFTLPSPSGRLLGVALSRADRDFDESDRDLLNHARPYLIQAYRNALEHTLSVRGVGRGRTRDRPADRAEAPRALLSAPRGREPLPGGPDRVGRDAPLTRRAGSDGLDADRGPICNWSQMTPEPRRVG